MFARILACGAAAAALAGCTATVHPQPVTTTGSDYVVYDRYPNTVYSGRRVYWIDDQWRYRDGNRWYGYSSEPPELYRYRSGVQVAPPAYRAPSAPPPPRSNTTMPPASAPPATRVR